jgi:hypothetical protein
MGEARRSAAEVAEAVTQMDKLIAGGLSVEAASNKVDLATSAYRRAKKKAGIPVTPQDTRRSPAQIAKDVQRVSELREQGVKLEDACKQVGIAKSVYWYNAQHKTKGNGQAGAISVDMIPPRPKSGPGSGKGGKRVPKAVDLNNIASVASRIVKLRGKIQEVSDLKAELKRLSKVAKRLLAV